MNPLSFRRSMYMRDMTRVLALGIVLLLFLVPDALKYYVFPKGLFFVLYLVLCIGVIFCNVRLLYQIVVCGKEQEINDDQ